MNSHEIGWGRGGTATALRRMRARPTIVGVDSDRLYPLHQQAELADLLGDNPPRLNGIIWTLDIPVVVW
jgi:homoserine O-acetyltransferase